MPGQWLMRKQELIEIGKMVKTKAEHKCILEPNLVEEPVDHEGVEADDDEEGEEVPGDEEADLEGNDCQYLNIFEACQWP